MDAYQEHPPNIVGFVKDIIFWNKRQQCIPYGLLLHDRLCELGKTLVGELINEAA